MTTPSGLRCGVLTDKKAFAEWMTHLGVCVGRPMDRTTLTSYWLELKERVEPDELPEAVRLLIAGWQEERLPKVWHLLGAVRRTRARRSREALRLVRRLDLDGFDLTSEHVRRYVGCRVGADLEDTEAARAVLACPLPALRHDPLPAALATLRSAMASPSLPALPPEPPAASLPKMLVAGIGDGPSAGDE